MRRSGLLLLVLAACPAAHLLAGTGTERPALSAVARLGKKLFFDPALSASGRQSCASCHDPAYHFGPPNGLSVQPGGRDGLRPGLRAVPSLAYLDRTPPFTVGPESLIENDAIVEVPGGIPARTVADTMLVPRAVAKQVGVPAEVARGGLFWDGRAATFQEQALEPLLSPFEMANPDAQAVVAKLARASYARDFQRLFGVAIFRDPRRTFDEAGFALARFQLEDPRFHPYSSQYDAWLKGRAKLSPTEMRGLRLFEDPAKGNCAACHPTRRTPDGRPPIFTDHEFEALAPPRNPAIPANANPAYFDLGLCGTLRNDEYARQAANCGLFKTPTLRNVATRHVFFHNGIYHDLKAVLRFYARRETAPEIIYPRRADGSPARYDDLPGSARGNVDRVDAPFDRKPGGKPALSEAEMDDIIVFLKTLTDH